MNLLEFFKTLSVGGWLSIVIVLSTLIEIAPIKINPIQWLGNHINKSMFDKVNSIESKVDQHIAEGYRNSILKFQDRLLQGQNPFTLEEWAKIIDSCSAYEQFCKDNKIQNDVIKLAIRYIKQEYNKALTNKDFLNLPIVSEVGDTDENVG